MNEERLSGLPLFASLSKRERREVATHADEVDVREGTRFIGEGEFAYEFCVIEEGGAEVLVEGRQVAQLGPGDFVGEMGVLARGRRNASVVATSPVTLIVMTGRDFRAMNEKLPSVAEQIRAKVEERTRALAG